MEVLDRETGVAFNVDATSPSPTQLLPFAPNCGLAVVRIGQADLSPWNPQRFCQVRLVKPYSHYPPCRPSLKGPKHNLLPLSETSFLSIGFDTCR